MSTSPPALPIEEPTFYISRVAQKTFEPLINVFFGIAMVSASTRLVLQLKTYRRLQVDDCLLIFACVCLTTSTVLGYVNVKSLYWDQALNYNPTFPFYLMKEHVDIKAHVITYQRPSYSYPALLWATIFSVKFAYLAFFRRLVDRVRPLIIYWRIILGLSAVSFPVCIISIYVVGWKWGQAADTRLQLILFHRALAGSISDTILDIITDLMITGIPIYLLWSVQIQTRQKVIMGIFLSLNVFIIFTAAVRVSGITFHGTFVVIWFSIWQHIEACVAVIVISLTAFHSVYINSQSSRARREQANRPWLSSTVAAITRKKALNRSDRESTPGLPTIPSATLTGMRTFILGGRRTGAGLQTTNLTATDRIEPEQWLLQERAAKYPRVQVENDLC